MFNERFSPGLCMKFCQITHIINTFCPHPKTLLRNVGMNKKAAFDKIRLLAEISDLYNLELILKNTQQNERERVKALLTVMRIFSSGLLDYTHVAHSKT